MMNPENDPLRSTAHRLRQARDARPATRIGRIGRWFVIVTIVGPVALLIGMLVWSAVDLAGKLL